MNTDQFKQAMAKLPKPETDKRPPYWEAWRLDLWQRAQNQDPTQFWEWPCVYHTMMQNHIPFQMDYELSQLNLSRWQYALQVPHFGPDDYSTGTRYSMNLIHQAYHLTQWERATGKRIETLETIVEFGGGYGAMALLCKRMGFEGKYVIYDLPEFSLLQEYYLSQFGMLDKTEWNPTLDITPDLFIALYSVSEVEPELRVIPNAKSFLFLYSGKWEQWDNVLYFQKIVPKAIKKKWQALQWQHTEIGHLPDRANWYSLGW